MKAVNEIIEGKITGFNERTNELTIVAKYDDYMTMAKRDYNTVSIQLVDSRPISSKQRKSCYAMIREIADWSGDLPSEIKEYLKADFIATESLEMMDSFSLSNAPMSVVAAFQKWLARFIVRNEVPCKKSLLSYVDDVQDYIYACLIHKKCCICGQNADLHHVDTVGMGRDRTEIIHEGMKVLPLCREHHQEIHSKGTTEFLKLYHIDDGIPADKTICKIYHLKARKGE